MVRDQKESERRRSSIVRDTEGRSSLVLLNNKNLGLTEDESCLDPSPNDDDISNGEEEEDDDDEVESDEAIAKRENFVADHFDDEKLRATNVAHLRLKADDVERIQVKKVLITKKLILASDDERQERISEPTAMSARKEEGCPPSIHDASESSNPSASSEAASATLEPSSAPPLMRQPAARTPAPSSTSANAAHGTMAGMGTTNHSSPNIREHFSKMQRLPKRSNDI